jgi:hypothetical protein
MTNEVADLAQSELCSAQVPKEKSLFISRCTLRLKDLELILAASVNLVSIDINHCSLDLSSEHLRNITVLETIRSLNGVIKVVSSYKPTN